MIWRCHTILCFHFYFVFRSNGIREQLYHKDFCWCYGENHFASTWSQLCSMFSLNNYKTPWQCHIKDTLQLKILPTWINVGVELALRHLIYCNFCRNLFTFLCLKGIPLLINFSNVYQPGHLYSNPQPPSLLPLPYFP